MSRRAASRTASPIIVSVGLAVASCAYVNPEQTPSCTDDPTLCPPSSKQATAVACECTCKVGMFADERTFKGRVKACLPAELNDAIASPEQRSALAAMDARLYDQRVYRYCSGDVAGFVQGVILTQARSFMACGVPLSCECTTAGASLDSGACRTRCPDVACNAESCPDILYTTVLDMGWCGCSRASACAASYPAADEPHVCLATSFAVR